MTGFDLPDADQGRKRVTHPRTRAARRARRAPVLPELDDPTLMGELLLRSLMRAQLRLALRMSAVFGLVLGALPLVFGVLPSVADYRVVGFPVAWLVLGPLVFPPLVLLGASYVRRAERNEAEFTDLVERS